MRPQRVNKKSTIYDVAAKAGTSAATVSRVIANNGYPVSPELRGRILDAAKALNYTPNAVGRMLKKSDSTDIGILIPTISNPYYSTLLLGAEQEARRAGYNLFLCNSLRDAATERKYLQSLFQKQVRGIIISSVGENHAFLNGLRQYGVSFVAIDRDTEGLQCATVGFDYAAGAELAVAHLLECGHRDIAFLSSPMTRRSRRDVLAGYRKALEARGVRPDETRILLSESESELVEGAYEFHNGKRLARRFLELDPRPTAILAINDLTAFGILQELFSSGVRVPEDVSVAGLDNLELSGMVSPPLTTVEQPALETGRLACRMLLDGMAKGDAAAGTVLLEPRLVVRRSVRRIV